MGIVLDLHAVAGACCTPLTTAVGLQVVPFVVIGAYGIARWLRGGDPGTRRFLMKNGALAMGLYGLVSLGVLALLGAK